MIPLCSGLIGLLSQWEKWHFIAVTWNRKDSTVRLYCDGKQVRNCSCASNHATSAFEQIAENSTNYYNADVQKNNHTCDISLLSCFSPQHTMNVCSVWQIGCKLDDGRTFNGRLCDVWIIGEALDADRVLDLFHARPFDGKPGAARVRRS